MPKTLTQLAADLGLSAAALQAFLKRRGDLRCVDAEATFSDAETAALRAALAVESGDAPNAGVVGMTVSHFKAFGTPQHVALRPLTLVFGQNSVGKSSFLHALLWAQHVATTGELDVVNPLLAGNSVHLGGFDNVVYRRRPGESFSLGFDVQTPPMNSFLPRRLRFGVRASFHRPKPSPGDLTPAPRPMAYELAVEDLPLLKARLENPREGFVIEEIDVDHPLFAEAFRRIAGLRAKDTSSLSPAAVRCLRQSARRLCARMRLQGGHLLPKRAVLLEAAAARRKIAECKRADTAGWLAIMEATLPQLIHWLVSTAAERVSDYLRSLSYLGPLRAYPDRSFSLSDRTDPNWRAGGGQAWELLRDEASLRDEVNAFLGKNHLQTGYQFRLNRFVDAQAAAKALAKDAALRRADAAALERALESPELPQRSELALYDLRNRMEVSHRDVGVGLSQVVPVLVFAAAARAQTIIVEQPELHIHPALQADLGDVFLKSALLHGNRFVLETHSEHLMLRLLKRVRQCGMNDPAYPKDWPKLTPEMISVVCAKPEENGTQLVPVPLSADGDFAQPWPDGFFTERGRELFS